VIKKDINDLKSGKKYGCRRTSIGWI